MPTIEPFRGYRFDLGKVGPLSSVVAPPYDVIGPALYERLLAMSPYNVVRADFGRDEVGDTDRENRTTRSARVLREWLQNDVLRQDTHRAVYVVHQDYEVDGKRFTRRGVLARVWLERFGEGSIYPHEQTLAGPKAERLALFRATAMNLSPVFGLYPDPGNEVQSVLDAAVGRALPVEATDHLGVTSRLWPVTDQAVLSDVAGLLGPAPVFIADGHHRYETSLRYRDEVLGPDSTDATHPANFCLMMLVSMGDSGLTIQPTHRLMTGLPDAAVANLPALLGDVFDVQPMPGLRETWEAMQIDGGQEVLGFGTAAGWHLATLRDPDAMAAAAPDKSVAWRGLGVSVLHRLAVPRLAGDAAPQFKYVHTLEEVEAGGWQVAALVPPAGLKQVEAVAGGGELMPAKSTYFYPKLLTGLVLHSLKGH